MKRRTSSPLLIIPNALSRTLLENAIQAKMLVDYIMDLNIDGTLEPGHLNGISLMLKNAQRTFAEASAALPEMYYMPNAASRWAAI